MWDACQTLGRGVPFRQSCHSGLDAPTNDLDVETLQALEDALTDYAGCAVIISHNRFFPDRIATHMLAFEGDAHVEWFEGNFADYEEDKKRRLGVDELIPHRTRHKKFARWDALKAMQRWSLAMAELATTFKRMNFKKFAIFIVSILTILAGSIISIHYKKEEPPYLVASFVEVLKTLGATGLAVLALNLWIETDDWITYFKEKMGSMLIEQRYMDGLSPEMLDIVTLNVMRAKFKTNIEAKDSFFEHFTKDFVKYIGEPYRENVVAIVEYSEKSQTEWIVIDQMSFLCRKIGGRIQDTLRWLADEADRPLKIEVLLYPESGEERQVCVISGEAGVPAQGADVSSESGVADKDAFFILKEGISLSKYQHLQSFRIKIKSEYIQSKARYSAWSMSEPSRNIEITIFKPPEYGVIWDNMIVREDEVDTTKGHNFRRISYEGWLLPENGFVWQLQRQLDQNNSKREGLS